MEKQNKPIEEAQNDFNNAQISVTKKAAKKYLDHETTNITKFLEDVNKGKI